MFTAGEIEQILIATRMSEHGPGIDFDWFPEVVEAADRCQILRTGDRVHEVQVDAVHNPGADNEGYRLMLVVNGSRFASELLTYTNSWSEDKEKAPVAEQVLSLLITAMEAIHRIEQVRDTWYRPAPVGP